MAEFIRVKIGDTDTGFTGADIEKVKKISKILEIEPDEVIHKAIVAFYERVMNNNE